MKNMVIIPQYNGFESEEFFGKLFKGGKSNTKKKYIGK